MMEILLMRLLIISRYTEAVKILYTANRFHFRGPRGVLELASFLPRRHWECIRSLHISFIAPLENWWILEVSQVFGPTARRSLDFISGWRECWRLVPSLVGLRCLGVDVLVSEYEDGVEDGVFDEGLMVAVFEPMVGVKVAVFEVRVNVEVPEEFWGRLGSVGFRTTVRRGDV